MILLYFVCHVDMLGYYFDVILMSMYHLMSTCTACFAFVPRSVFPLSGQSMDILWTIQIISRFSAISVQS